MSALKGEFVMLYVTARDREEAEEIGGEVVKLRLAACANVLDGVHSIYWWEGEVEKASEALLILKTRRALVKEAISKIKEIHSYENPCIVAYPVIAGSEDYLEWIEKETQKSGARTL